MPELVTRDLEMGSSLYQSGKELFCTTFELKSLAIMYEKELQQIRQKICKK